MTAPTAHALSPADLAQILQTDLRTGLSEDEARRRLARHGPNTLPEQPGPTFWQLLFQQFASPLILLLGAATLLALIVGEVLDAVVILAIVVLNAAIGVAYEWRAERAVRALRRLVSRKARVIRAGQLREIAAENLVPGDLVMLEAGDAVPADMRLVEAVNLEVDESPLTGESLPVTKRAETILDPDAPLGDRVNMVFLGTVVMAGRGRGIVYATGRSTALGEIAELLQRYEEQVTPLERRLTGLARVLAGATVAIAAALAVAGLLQGRGLGEAALVAITLAVAAVPEGLPAVVTVVLAVGLLRMARRRALVRRLAAVEALGSVTVIATDKTGTLTRGEMVAVRLWTSHQITTVSGQGTEPVGDFRADDRPVDPRTDPVLPWLLLSVVLANDAFLEISGQVGPRPTYRIVGNATDGALLVLGAKAGYHRPDLERQYPRIAEVPFIAERKRLTTVHRGPGTTLIFMKGAPEVVLGHCQAILTPAGPVPLTDVWRHTVLTANAQLADAGMRVLAAAYREGPPALAAQPPASLEQGLVFLGLVGLHDPPRPEIAPALATARQAGIRTLMITGDSPRTARAIARQIGLLRPGGRILTGAELDRLDQAQLTAIIAEVDICARVTPIHKVRVVEALQARGHVVAMTGDGVNDAPALQRADVGVAMGLRGTDVAKEAADMVLLDDNYATIVAAIAEGRVIYDNLRKFVTYLLSTNLAEIVVVGLAVLIALPLPLPPTHILWVNLLTDSFPALALGLEPPEEDVMKRPPRPPGEPLLTRWHWLLIGSQALLIATVTLTAFAVGLRLGGDEPLPRAQTLAFATLVAAEVLRAHAARSFQQPLHRLGALRNRPLLAATVVSGLLCVTVIYLPPLQAAFRTTPLGPGDWGLVGALALLPLIGAEWRKMIAGRGRRAAV